MLLSPSLPPLAPLSPSLLAWHPCSSVTRRRVTRPQVSLDTSAAPFFNATAATQLALKENPGDQMPLLDCAFATGSPNGLMCDKEGTFVVGWEKRGQWIAGGGSVPLSRALCCRLGVPDNVTSETMPEVPLTPAKPVAAVSFGCHPSTINGPMQVRIPWL